LPFLSRETQAIIAGRKARMQKFTLLRLIAVSIFLVFYGVVPVRPETVGAVIFTNAKMDGSFNQLAAIGSERAAAEFGLEIREWISTDPDETMNVIRQFAKSGVNHILTLGFESSELVRTTALEFPDVKFTSIDGVISDLPNVRSILFADDESGFLAGYVAGLKTRTGTVGTIGGMDIPPVRRFMCGFEAGARYANADVSVLSSFVGQDMYAFRNIQGGKAIADKMFADGADVIFAPAGMAAEGVARAAREQDAHVIMVDANKNGFLPGTVLTSALKRVDEAAYATWKAAIDDTWTPGLVVMTTRDKGVGWAVDEHNRDLVSDVEDQVNAIVDGLAAGSVAIVPGDSVAGCADVL
jgi:basic membrane protein A